MEINVKLVEDALEHLWDYNRIGAHALADALLRPPRGGRVRPGLMERGAALNKHLIASIEQVKVPQPNTGKSRERRYHAILTGCFVEGLSNREVARSLSISERTFYRERLNALVAFTRLLADGTGRGE